MVRRLVALIGAIVLVAFVVLQIRRRYALCELYDPARFVGLSRAEVTQILGPPFYEIGGGSEWGFQFGMDPTATVSFKDDRVVRFEFLEWRCPPFSF